MIAVDVCHSKDLIGNIIAEDKIGLVLAGVSCLQEHIHEEPGNAVVTLDLVGASLHLRQCQGVAILVNNCNLEYWV